MKINAETLECAFPDILQAFCMDMEYDFYPDYSGRGMYGSRCPGIVHGGDQFAIGVQLAAYVAENCADLDEATDTLTALAHMVDGAAWDSMGLRQILYFPSLAG